MTSFGHRLKIARKNLKMNQKKALGDAIGVGQTTIANYEKGLRFPTGELLKQLGEVLNVSLDELMNHKVVKLNKFGFAVNNISNGGNMSEARKVFQKKALIDGQEQKKALALIWSLEPDSDNIRFIYEEVLMKSLVAIGELWADNVIDVATEHFASSVCHKTIAMLSTITMTASKGSKKAVCMSLSSESHTIGVRMVSEYLNLIGVTSYYLGTTVPTTSLIDMLIRESIDILAISVTMSYHIDGLKNLIRAIKSEAKLSDLAIVLGGQALSGDDVRIEDFRDYSDELIDIAKNLKDIEKYVDQIS